MSFCFINNSRSDLIRLQIRPALIAWAGGHRVVLTGLPANQSDAYNKRSSTPLRKSYGDHRMRPTMRTSQPSSFSSAKGA